jgi:hypothetical protein
MIAATLLATSCMSMKPMDVGVFNPKHEVADTSSTINVDSAVRLFKVDGTKVGWGDEQGRPKIIARLVPGFHTFSASFDDGQRHSYFPLDFFAQLEPNAEYNVIAVIEGDKFHFDVVDAATKQSVILDLVKLQGKKKDMVSQFIKYVLNPTMDEVKHTVKLENDSTVVLLGPDLAYSQTDKGTGAKTAGRHGFEMSFTMTSATLYLFETDLAKMSSKEFLDNSNYQEKATIAWTPLECSATSVTFQIVRPAARAGEKLKFSITELK